MYTIFATGVNTLYAYLYVFDEPRTIVIWGLTYRKPVPLIVMACHERIMHGGVKDTLTELKSKYWIVKGRSFVKKLLQRCVVCRRIHGKPFLFPRSPSLPGFRVQESPPFSYTGVDFAGPLYVKSGEGKVWICLYTCCSSRAVHLEVVPDLTAEAFIRCSRRFVARRGIPRKIISDNGKTFKAATPPRVFHLRNSFLAEDHALCSTAFIQTWQARYPSARSVKKQRMTSMQRLAHL